jgi:hypothetical protein
MRLAVVGYLNDEFITTKLTFDMTQDGRRFASQFTLPVNTGKSAIVEFKPTFANPGAAAGADVRPVYLVLTPERVRQ